MPMRTVPNYDYTPIKNSYTSARRYGPYARAKMASAAITTAVAATRKYFRKKRTVAPTVKQAAKRQPRGYNKNIYRKRNVPIETQIKKLTKKVSALSKDSTAKAELIFKYRNTARCLAAVNQQTHLGVDGNSINNYESVLAQLRFFDSATPGTLVQASGVAGTYNTTYHFKSVYATGMATNNYQVPCVCTLYWLCPKDDTTIDPVTAFTNGLADIGNPSSSSQMVYLSMSPQFGELWKICSSVKRTLMPGQSITSNFAVKDVYYNPSVVDSQTQTYQRKYKCFALVCRVDGVLAHDTSADQQGFSQGGVDIMYQCNYKVHYDAGGDLTYVYLQDNSDTFTNGAVISSKPVSDNIGYSVA